MSYRDDDFARRLLEATDGRGVDVILDMAGGQHAVSNIEALARRGRLVHLSPGNGAEFSAPLRAIMAKEAVVTGSLLRPLPDVEKAAIAADLRRVVWPLVAAGRVRPVIHRQLALARAREAHALMEGGQYAGKIVLVTAGSAIAQD